VFLIRIDGTGLFWNGDEFQASYREARRYKSKDSARFTVRKIKKDVPLFEGRIKIVPEFSVVVWQGDAIKA